MCGKPAGRVLDEQDRIEIQQRVAQRQTADRPAGVEVRLGLRRRRGVGRNLPRGHISQGLLFSVDRRPEIPQVLGQLEAAFQQQADRVQRARPSGHLWRGARLAMGDRPFADALLRGRATQGQILLAADAIDLDLVEMEVAVARQLQAEITGLRP